MADEKKVEEKVEEGEEGTEVAKQGAEVPLSEQQIIGRYKQMRAEVQALATKMAELDVDAGEHQYDLFISLGVDFRYSSDCPLHLRLVIDTLTDGDPGRKAFRLFGGVLVERTAGEILPDVKQNREWVS
jgi:prefoldin subunit 2